MAEPQEENAVVDSGAEPLVRPKHNKRQSSFSDALTKFTTSTFNRRCTTTQLGHSTSSNTLSQASPIPTPSGIPRTSSFFSNLSVIASKSTSQQNSSEGGIESSQPQRAVKRSPSGIPRSSSFFSSLNTFASKAPTNTGGIENEKPGTIKRTRKISNRLAQTRFFSQQHQRVVTPAPITPSKNRKSSIKIEQRGLMHPIYPSSLPRSSTMGNLSQGQRQGQQKSPNTPSFMRPTSSSAARRSSIRTDLAKQRSHTPMTKLADRRATFRNTPLPTRSSYKTLAKTPNLLGPPTRIPTPIKKSNLKKAIRSSDAYPYPVRSDSLMAPPTEALSDMSLNEPSANHAVLSSPFPDYSEEATDQQKHAYSTNQQAQASSASEQPQASTSKQPAHADSAHAQRQANLACEEKLRQLHKKLADEEFGTFMGEPSTNPSVDEYDTLQLEKMEEQAKEANQREALTSDGASKHSDVEVEPEYVPSPGPDMSNPRLVNDAQPPMWWLGRYTALSDRFRTSALRNPPSATPSLTSSRSSNTTHHSNPDFENPMHDDARRNRRVYSHLRNLCTTEVARQSLDEFKVIMEERERKAAERAAGNQGKAVKEKKGWLEGLMGKKKGK